MAGTRHSGILVMLCLVGLPSVSTAEYLIYLKGGHFMIVDDCSFADSRAADTASETDEQSVLVDDCARGKPKGPIYWSTGNGQFGELDADDVYAILGTKDLPSVKPSGVATPLEDYLVTTRDESFMNAKIVEQEGVDVYGLKRDELATMKQRGVREIAPERLAKSRSGEGLCSGEPPEFAVSEVDVVEGHLLGSVTNRSKEAWRAELEVEVRVKGRFLGKFEVKDRNVLDPNESSSIDSPVDPRFLKELTGFKDPDAGVRLCYRKIKTTAGSTAK
ncbi:MAG: hypothetical protein C3F12_10375 [Candidatus Methylomirabilota bacterium]|nr:MAG: hypothetical protein C3F12_10375 [candidate division NC10 bacterium]